MNKKFDISLVGLGKGGSNIATTFFKKKYIDKNKLFFINTHFGEMSKLPGEFFDSKNPQGQKLCIFGEGTGRDVNSGMILVQNYKAELKKFATTHFQKTQLKKGEENISLVILCVGGGGGSGAAIAPFFIETLLSLGINVGLIYTLPLASDGVIQMANAIKTFNILSGFKRNIAPFFLIDNDFLNNTIEKTNSAFWSDINNRIADILLPFEYADLENSEVFNPIDRMEYFRVLRFQKGKYQGYNDFVEFELKKNGEITAGLIKKKIDETAHKLNNDFDYNTAGMVQVIIEIPSKMKSDIANKMTKEIIDSFDVIYDGKNILQSTVYTEHPHFYVTAVYSGLVASGRLADINESINESLEKVSKEEKGIKLFKPKNKFKSEFKL